MFESASEDSFDPEEYGSWTSIAIKGKSCRCGKEGVELDAREARELHGKTRSAQPVKLETTTKWYNMVDEQPSGGFASERPTKDELQQSGQEMWECTKPVGKNTFWRDTEEAAVSGGAGRAVNA